VKISCASCFGISPAISAQFTVEMCVAARNQEKFTQTLYFGGSKSFKVIDVEKTIRSWSPVLVMISSMPIHNRFYARRANSGKTKTFCGDTLLSRFCLKETSLPGGSKFRHKKTRVLRATHSEDFLILASTVLIQSQSDRQTHTHRQTDKQTSRPWLRRAKHLAVARLFKIICKKTCKQFI